MPRRVVLAPDRHRCKDLRKVYSARHLLWPYKLSVRGPRCLLCLGCSSPATAPRRTTHTHSNICVCLCVSVCVCRYASVYSQRVRSVLPECSPRDNLCALCFSCCRRVDSIAAVSAPHNAAAAAATTTIAKANNSDNIKHKTRNTKHVKRIAICATSWRMPRTHRCAACEEMREQVWGKGWHWACDSGDAWVWHGNV